LSSYRFCRTDDIGLLVEALNRCWAPYFPGEPPETPATFKRSIRDLQVWCSSCMVAFAGADPIGVLIGAKRAGATLIHRIAVHPDHRRQGHGRHLLASLGSKLAILGPPRIVAEVPEALAAACGLFGAAGYVQEALLTDYVLDGAEAGAAKATALNDGGFVIPVTIDDLAANGLLEADPHSCWERSVETLTARKDDLARTLTGVPRPADRISLLRKRPSNGSPQVRPVLSAAPQANAQPSWSPPAELAANGNGGAESAIPWEYWPSESLSNGHGSESGPPASNGNGHRLDVPVREIVHAGESAGWAPLTAAEE